MHGECDHQDCCVCLCGLFFPSAPRSKCWSEFPGSTFGQHRLEANDFIKKVFLGFKKCYFFHDDHCLCGFCVVTSFWWSLHVSEKQSGKWWPTRSSCYRSMRQGKRITITNTLVCFRLLSSSFAKGFLVKLKSDISPLQTSVIYLASETLSKFWSKVSFAAECVYLYMYKR